MAIEQESTADFDEEDFSRRVNRPHFGVRHTLVPQFASTFIAGVGENFQTEVEQYQKWGLPLDRMDKIIASIPFDMKALGLGLAAYAAVTLFHRGKTNRDIAIENAIIAAGLSKTSAEGPKTKKVAKKAGEMVSAIVAAYAAYKAGVHLPQAVDFGASAVLQIAGVGYVMYQKKRMTGKF